jgi:hypothetical protein
MKSDLFLLFNIFYSKTVCCQIKTQNLFTGGHFPSGRMAPLFVCVCLFVCLFVCVCVCLFVCLFVCVFDAFCQSSKRSSNFLLCWLGSFPLISKIGVNEWREKRHKKFKLGFYSKINYTWVWNTQLVYCRLPGLALIKMKPLVSVPTKNSEELIIPQFNNLTNLWRQLYDNKFE